MATLKKFVHTKISPGALDTLNAARFCGISEALMRKLRGQGNGPNYSKVNSKIVYPISELKKFLEKNLVDGGAK